MLDDYQRFIGEEIDGYVLCEVVGNGSFGVVFAAEERSFGEAVGTVAIKLMRPKDSVSRAAVVREVRAMAGLSHPNLVSYRSSGEVSSGPLSGCHYVATELASYTLEDEIVRRGHLDEGEIRSLALDLASALSYLHAQQAVHRDVKPENVLRVKDSWKLADFGLVRAFSGSQLSASGSKGTPFYMSPEALNGQTGPHVDVWAFGVLLQRAATGSFPFAGGSDAEVFTNILTKEALIPSGLPGWLETMIRGCLSKDRSTRPDSASLLAVLRHGHSMNQISVPPAPSSNHRNLPETSADAPADQIAAGRRNRREMFQQSRSRFLHSLGRVAPLTSYWRWPITLFAILLVIGSYVYFRPADFEAQYERATMYSRGIGLPKDEAQAAEIYRRLAEKGYAPAQYKLAGMYASGRGVARDETRAVELYRKSAEQGYDMAQYSLGQRYLKGDGVPQDDAQADYWYQKAGDQLSAIWLIQIGYHYQMKSGVENIPRYNARAAYWFRKAADQGEGTAQYILGVFYLEGRGVPQDEVLGADWIRKAAEQGGYSQFLLGELYEQGRGVPQDTEQAAYWYGKAAARGNDLAKKALLRLEDQL